MNTLRMYLCGYNMPRWKYYRIERNAWMIIAMMAMAALVAAVVAL